MGMTIDTAITVLGMVEAHGICIEAKDIAVETMHKYQKIKEILKDDTYYEKYGSNAERFIVSAISEVEDGKNTI